MEDITSEREIAEALKPKVAIQCAKSAILISSLKNTTLDYANLNQNKVFNHFPFHSVLHAFDYYMIYSSEIFVVEVFDF